MTTIEFTIHGNHKDPTGNPIPYKRVLNHAWRADSRDYMDWCEYVRKNYFEQTEIGKDIGGGGGYRIRGFDKNTGKAFKPIYLPKHKAQVSIKAYWRDGKHGDLDNVLKGILDALFENDKCVNGLKASAEMAEDKKGKVEVKIIIQ